MVQQQRFSQHFLLINLICLFITNSLVYTNGENQKTLMQNFEIDPLVQKTLILSLIIIGIHTISLRLSRKEARRLREEDNLSWKDLLKIHKIHTKDYWKRALYLVIGTTDKINDIIVKTKTPEGWYIKKTHKYRPPTGLFGNLFSIMRTSTKRISAVLKDTQTVWSLIMLLVSYEIYKDKTNIQQNENIPK